MVDGIRRLVDSDLEGPTNIGLPEYVSVKELVETVADVAKKRVETKYVPGPVGVQSRNFSNAKINSIGWTPRFCLRDGIRQTYPWIEAQVMKGRSSRPHAEASTR
jgi:nucleoside-diphosphate-sugar epimerase